MIICKNCGAKLADHSKICYACKAKVEDDWKRVSEYDAIGSNFDVTIKADQDNNFSTDSGNEHSTESYNRFSTDSKDNDFSSDPDNDLPEEMKKYLDKLNISSDDVFKKMDQESGSPEVTEEEKLIGDGAWMYALRFKKMREKNSIFSWNWWAFLLGPIWFAYHKMYVWTIALLGVDALFTFIDPKAIGSVLIDIVIAIFANRLLMDHVESLKNKADTMSGDKKERYIEKRGGTSMAATVVIIGIYYAAKYYFLRTL